MRKSLKIVKHVRLTISQDREQVMLRLTKKLNIGSKVLRGRDRSVQEIVVSQKINDYVESAIIIAARIWVTL